MSCHVEQRNDLHRIVSYRLGEYNVKNDDDDDHDDDNDNADGWRWLLDDKTLGICTTIAVDVCTSKALYSMSNENTNTDSVMMMNARST